MCIIIRKISSILLIALFLFTNNLYALTGSRFSPDKLRLPLKYGFSEKEKFYGAYDKWLNWPISEAEVVKEGFNAYDYRFEGKGVFNPGLAFLFGIQWADMYLKKARQSGNTDRHVLVVRDSRDIRTPDEPKDQKLPPLVMQALIAGLRYKGLDVINASEDIPSSTSTYSVAMHLLRAGMGIFLTVSHISRPERDREGNLLYAVGFKVAMKEEIDGPQNSLTAEEIQSTKEALAELVRSRAKIARAEKIGSYAAMNIEELCVRYVNVIAQICSEGGDLYEFDEAIRNSDDPMKILVQYEVKYKDRQPFLPEGAGKDKVKIAIDAARVVSGKVAKAAIDILGAEAVLINPYEGEIKGKHNADPANNANLLQLIDLMQKQNIELGAEFDFDGDRLGLVQRSEDGTYRVLNSDELMVVVLGSLIESLGYNPVKIEATHGKEIKVAIVCDILASEALEEKIDRVTHNFDYLKDKLKLVRTDTGYVNLKKAAAQLEREGYIVIMMGEASGHGWLRVTGAFENPLAYLMVYISKGIKKYQARFNEMYLSERIPFKKSDRSMPYFHPALLQRVSDDVRKGKYPLDWKYDPESNVRPPPEAIDLCKHYAIEAILENFPAHKDFITSYGKRLRVTKCEPEKGFVSWAGMEFYKYVVIKFEEVFGSGGAELGIPIGRMVVRGSANDPQSAMNFEVNAENVRAGGIETDKEVIEVFNAMGGYMLTWFEDNGILNVTKAERYDNDELLKNIVKVYRGLAHNTHLKKISPVRKDIDDGL